MRQVRILVGMTCLALAAPGFAAPDAKAPATVAAAPVAVPDNALRLSRLVNPDAKMLEVGMKGFEVGIDTELKRNPEEAAVYDRNPGLLDAIRDAGRPVIRKHLVTVIPSHQRRFAQFYAEKFTPEEIDQLVQFYSSPTGAKVIDAMYAGKDLEKIVAASPADAAKSMTAKDVAEYNRAAAAQLPDKFETEDWRVLFMFAATPVHAKLMRVVPEFHQLVADIENEGDAELDKQMDEAVGAAVTTYMAKRKDKPAQ